MAHRKKSWCRRCTCGSIINGVRDKFYVEIAEAEIVSDTIHLFTDKDKSRIILIQPAERALYAAGTGGESVSGYTVIFAHASESSIQGVDLSNRELFNQFVDMIRNSGAWEPGKPVMIDACNAGKLDAGVASALAKALNTKVVAPTTQTWNFPSWSTSVFTGAYPPASDNKNDTVQNNIPNLTSPGKWKTFGPDGLVIRSDKNPPGAK